MCCLGVRQSYHSKDHRLKIYSVRTIYIPTYLKQASFAGEKFSSYPQGRNEATKYTRQPKLSCS